MTELSKAEQKLREKIARLYRFHTTETRGIIKEPITSHEFAAEIYVFIEEALPELAKEADYFQEEAGWVGHLLDKGWIPPEEANETIEQAYFRGRKDGLMMREHQTVFEVETIRDNFNKEHEKKNE